MERDGRWVSGKEGGGVGLVIGGPEPSKFSLSRSRLYLSPRRTQSWHWRDVYFFRFLTRIRLGFA